MMSGSLYLFWAIASIMHSAAAFTIDNVHRQSSSALCVGGGYLDNLASPSEQPLSSSQENKEEPSATYANNSLLQLLQLAAATGRGEFASAHQKETAARYIDQLEANNPTAQPTTTSSIRGTWELVYTDTQLFRSSPFFMAGRAVCTNQDQAKQYDWFCDMHRAALAISNILNVRQIITATSMISEFEVKAGAIPFLRDFTPFSYSGGMPVTIGGAIVSTADITPTNNGKAWELYMDTVQIKGSNIPGIRQLLDQSLQLQSRRLASVLESAISGYKTPKPVFETTFLSKTIRISRDQDDKVFVYVKVSDKMEATDYSNVMPDFGVTKLLEGFNDAVTKFYL
jgi:hypothetical protein